MSAKLDAERRYAQIEGERDCQRSRAVRLEHQRDALAEALDAMLEDGGWVCGDWYPSEDACEKARAALAAMEGE